MIAHKIKGVYKRDNIKVKKNKENKIGEHLYLELAFRYSLAQNRATIENVISFCNTSPKPNDATTQFREPPTQMKHNFCKNMEAVIKYINRLMNF